MLKETITYTDFNGDTQTEDFYFNLTTAELAKMEIYHNGGLQKHLERVVASNDGRTIMNAFEEIIKSSYGIRTPDGKTIIKSDQIYAEFAGSEAYSVFFMKIISDPDFATLFVRGIVPANLAAQAAEVEAKATPGFRPGAQTLPQARIDQLAQYEREAAAQVPTPPVEAAQPETRIFEGFEPVLPSESLEDTQPTDTPELQAAREAAFQQDYDGSLPEDPLQPHEPGYQQGLTRRQARELGLL